MQAGKLNIVLDAFWGSSGKGKLSTFLADKFGVRNVSCSNFPNAGHTAQFEDGMKFVAKVLPTPAILNRRGRDVTSWLTPGCGFRLPQLLKEREETGGDVVIHDRASIVCEDHAARERSATRHIASTMQGSGAALSDKIMRQNVLLARDVRPVACCWKPEVFRDAVDVVMRQGMWLHEGSQGYALSIDHGTHYPHCTSRNCTTAKAIDDLGVSPRLLGDVYLNLRTWPIRVGNCEGGFSGDFPDECGEVTWDYVADWAGMPTEEREALAERERTTVTKRIRRVATFPFQLLVDAVKTNGANKLVLNFVQYLDWRDHKKRRFVDLSERTRHFIDEIEKFADVPVVIVGTGANHEDMAVREDLL